jgi:hypothetical protein
MFLVLISNYRYKSFLKFFFYKNVYATRGTLPVLLKPRNVYLAERGLRVRLTELTWVGGGGVGAGRVTFSTMRAQAGGGVVGVLSPS